MKKTLTLIDKAFFLKQTSLFDALDLDLLLSISHQMETLTFKAKSSVFLCESVAQKLYLIMEGVVELRDGQKRILTQLDPGDFFGDEALFNDRPRAYEAFCPEGTLLIALSRSHLLSILAECPTVALRLLEAYAATTDRRR